MAGRADIQECDFLCHGVAEIDASIEDFSHGVQENVWTFILGYIAVGAVLHGARRHRRVFVHGKNDHASGGVGGPEVPYKLKPARILQSQIQDDKPRLPLCIQLQPFLAAFRSMTAVCPPCWSSRRQPRPYNGMIVDDQDVRFGVHDLTHAGKRYGALTATPEPFSPQTLTRPRACECAPPCPEARLQGQAERQIPVHRP